MSVIIQGVTYGLAIVVGLGIAATAIHFYGDHLIRWAERFEDRLVSWRRKKGRLGR
jgi:hypothetical protein